MYVPDIYIYIYIYMIRARPAPSPPMVPPPFQRGCGGNGFIHHLWCGCGGGNAFITPCGVAVVVVMVSSTPCGVAVVVVLVSSTPCCVAVLVVMLSSILCGVAVVLVVIITLQGHNKAPKKATRTIEGSKGLSI